MKIPVVTGKIKATTGLVEAEESLLLMTAQIVHFY